VSLSICNTGLQLAALFSRRDRFGEGSLSAAELFTSTMTSAVQSEHLTLMLDRFF